MRKKNPEINFHKIKEKLAYYCAYQDRCHQDVEQKLAEFSLIPEARDEILLFLMRENYLNEERFAMSFARGKFTQKSWGKIKIAIELKKRHINQRLIDKGLTEIDPEEYYTTAAHLIQKKKNSLNERLPYILNQKIIRYMLQKGYENDLIRTILDEMEV